MKKILCIILSMAVILGSCVTLYASAVDSEKEVGFAVASDLHYVHTLKSVDASISDDGETTFRSESDSLTNQSGYILDEFLNQCAKDENCQFVLITGDLATHGSDYASEHEAIAEKFRKFEKETGKQVYVINGNHDNQSDGVVEHEKFISIYREFGYDEAFSTDEGSCSYSVNLNEEYALIALDSCDENYRLVPKVNISRMTWAVNQIKAAKKTGRKVILIMHHNLLEHDPFQKITQKNYVVNTPYSFAEVLADLGVKLVFTGHTHNTSTKSYTSLLGNTIYDFSMPSLGNFPAEYKSITLTDSEIKYETKKIEHIDADKLASVCKGYTQEEIDLMKNDFQSYAWNNSYADYYNSIKDGISPKAFNLEETGALYSDVKSITDEIQAIYDTHLYGENSIKTQVADYGLEIPDSNYKTMGDAITQAVLKSKSGDKTYALDSDDFKLLVDLVSYAIKKSISTSADENMLSTANELLHKCGYNENIADGAMARSFEKYGFTTPVEKEALSVAFALFGGFVSDTDGVDNRDGVLPGYEIKGDDINPLVAVIKSILEKILAKLPEIISAVIANIK